MNGLRFPSFKPSSRRRVLRVGYVEARPWSYRAEQGVPGLDTTAMSVVAAKMRCPIEYHPRSPSELANGLINGEYDLAIGGLLDPRHPDIVTVAVPHARILASVDSLRSRCQRVFFPNVWWVRRHDYSLRCRIVMSLFLCRFGMGMHADASDAGTSRLDVRDSIEPVG